jgi:hypothetical protein
VPWVLVDVGIGVLAVLLLLLATLLLYKRVRVLMRALGDASGRVGELTPGLTVQEPPDAR